MPLRHGPYASAPTTSETAVPQAETPENLREEIKRLEEEIKALRAHVKLETFPAYIKNAPWTNVESRYFTPLESQDGCFLVGYKIRSLLTPDYASRYLEELKNYDDNYAKMRFALFCILSKASCHDVSSDRVRKNALDEIYAVARQAL